MHNPKGFGSLETVLVLVILCIIGGATYYFLKHQTRVSTTNDGITFSFDLGIPAENKKRSDDKGTTDFYEAKLPDTNVILVAAAYKPKLTTVDKDMDCGKYKSFMVEILDKKHRVCIQRELSYVADFNSDKTWYQVSVFPQDLKTSLDQKTVSKLLSSIEIE